MSTTYGYVRVSSQDQNEDRHLIALREKLVDPIAKVNATKKYKFLGFAFGKGKDGLFIRAH